MSLAIHITTHAKTEDVEKAIETVRAIVADLDATLPEGQPQSTWAIYGNDYATERVADADGKLPDVAVRIDESTLEEV